MYSPVLQGLVQRGFTPETACRVYGSEYQEWKGTDRRGRDLFETVFDGQVRVCLDEPHLLVPLNHPPDRPYRVLPSGSALQVRGEEEHLDVLAPLVGDQGQGWVYSTLHRLSADGNRSTKTVVELRIDGKRIGELTPAMSAHFAPTIDHLADTGMLAVAKTLVKGNALKVEAVLYAAKAHELDSSWIATARDEPETVVSAASDDSRPKTVGELDPPLVIPAKPTKIVFNPPPGWEPPPTGWEPFPGWRPPPEWPAPPKGWMFWVTES